LFISGHPPIRSDAWIVYWQLISSLAAPRGRSNYSDRQVLGFERARASHTQKFLHRRPACPTHYTFGGPTSSQSRLIPVTIRMPVQGTQGTAAGERELP
jgi:hypothetical protein